MVSEISFPTAAENMAFDDSLLHASDRCFRLYDWQTPGLTYSYKQTLPEDLMAIDHAKRLTGGGIVFHSQGDLVFSCSAGLDDHLFPKSLRGKMGWFSDLFAAAFSDCGIALMPSAASGPQNLAFCNTYHNPFELYYENEKIVALTLRKQRYRFIIQGIIHLYDNCLTFADLQAAYGDFFSRGIPAEKRFIDEIRTAIKERL